MNHLRTRTRRAAILLALVLGGSLFGLTQATAAHDPSATGPGHCANHVDHPKLQSPQAGETYEYTLADGSVVYVVISDDRKSASFEDADGNPVDVDSCIKASNRYHAESGTSNSGVPANGGGQPPDISYLIVYEINDPDPGPECEVSGIELFHVDHASDPATNPVSTSHTVTAEVDSDDCDVYDVSVRFEVSRNPLATGQTNPVETGYDGQSDNGFNFTYTGPDYAATDTITACVLVDGERPPTTSNGGCSSVTTGNGFKDSVTKHWVTEDPECSVSDVNVVHLEGDDDGDGTARNPVNTQHSVEAEVTSQNCEAGDITVLFEVTRNGGTEIVATGTDSTDPYTFTYTGPSTGATDIITACVLNDGAEPESCDSVTAENGSSDTATKIWEPPVVEAEPTCQATVVGTDILGSGEIGRLFQANADEDPCEDDNASLLMMLYEGGLSAIIDPVLGSGGTGWWNGDGSLTISDPSGTIPGSIFVDVVFSRTFEEGSARAGILALRVNDGSGDVFVINLLVSGADNDCDGETEYTAQVFSVTLPDGTTVPVTDGETYVIDPEANDVVKAWLEDNNNPDSPEGGAQAVDAQVLALAQGGVAAFISDTDAGCE